MRSQTSRWLNPNSSLAFMSRCKKMSYVSWWTAVRALRDLRVSAGFDLLTLQVCGCLDDSPNKGQSGICRRAKAV